MKRLTLLRAALLGLLLSGCASAPDAPTLLRQALFGLGETATASLLREPVWTRDTPDVVLLLATPEVDDGLGVSQSRFTESLSRALLAPSDGPQVIDWAPEMQDSDSRDNQWLLETRLSADGPRLTLSDRELLPYALHMRLRRLGDSEPQWEETLFGAFDATAL
ncbi:hypothetical protein [Halomonas salipaludis]|uniref:Penicillin-binding protein activator LpoB n=1 Tax=Halomonas salipaludis TaxID=2032625 RepID=A0A2A2EXV5_9GAMM|nr:hypothetical protein [Halomonas salipaludis]PAU77518.1 hypothetical protein CK498_09865 [Halomonas salipaludis]